MKHEMKLKTGPYERIDNGTKTIELRLFDDKRKLIKPNDTITFTNTDTGNKLDVVVEEINVYSNFEELYKNYDKVSMGYEEEDVANPNDMNQYYSVEEQSQNGVIAIKIKKLR